MKYLNVIANEAVGRRRSENEYKWVLKVPNTTYGRQAIAEMRKLVKPQGRLVLRGRGPRKIYENDARNPYSELSHKFARYFAVYFVPNKYERKNPYRKEMTAVNKIADQMPDRGFYLMASAETPVDMPLVDRG